MKKQKRDESRKEKTIQLQNHPESRESKKQELQQEKIKNRELFNFKKNFS